MGKVDRGGEPKSFGSGYLFSRFDQRFLRKFKDEQVAAVTGTILVKNKRNLIEKCQAMEYVLIAWTRRLLDAVDSVFVTPGALSAYRKSAVE